MIDLRGRTAFITGSSQGVGLAIARAFALAGANLVLHGRTSEEFSPASLEELRSHSVQVACTSGDLAEDDPHAVRRLFEAAIAADSQIDLLVNNAGTFCDVPFLEMTREIYDRTMRLNVAAPYFLTQAFAQRWVASGTRGRVLMIGSINGRLAEPNHTAYDSSKGAIEAMVKTFCVSLAPLGIRVNGLAPGLVRTPLTAAIDREPRFARWMELHTPNGLVPGADVCGGAAVYLCSDFAEHVHGQMLLIDGGMSAWQQPDPPESWE